jgi:hypothetical protein
MIMDITQLSELELKALGFDIRQTLDRARKNYRLILAELAQRRRAAEAAAPASPEGEGATAPSEGEEPAAQE